jgi:NADPH:quinone reductase-like Zn-dependent oxidoreductase
MSDTGPGGSAWAINAYGAVDDLRRTSMGVPSPAGAQVVVEVEAASLNPLDLKLISGVLAQFMPVSFPFVPGSDVCGRITAIGPQVKNLRVGDRVVAMTPAHGAMATHVLCDSESAMVLAPRTVPAADLASLPEAGMTALAILREADLRPGQTVAIIGATGGIGLLLAQLAKRSGARVIATATAQDEDLVRAHGADEVVDYSRDDTVAAILASHPGGVDVIVDLVDQFDALLPVARAIRRGGRLISTLMGPDASAFGEGVDVHYVRLQPSARDLQQLVDHLTEGQLSSTVTLRFAYSEVPQAYLTLRDGHARGKIVVVHHQTGHAP